LVTGLFSDSDGISVSTVRFPEVFISLKGRLSTDFEVVKEKKLVALDRAANKDLENVLAVWLFLEVLLSGGWLIMPFSKIAASVESSTKSSYDE
jgi:hypothetical protein